jgi:phospholipid-binding lipoprotein MlaA
MPTKLKKIVTNFFANLDEIPSLINNLLQGKLKAASDNTARFVVNTTLGVGGLFDVATHGNIPARREDFGKTLAVWGYKSSNYLVLPILGPSTVRDGIGTVATNYMSIPTYLEPRTRNRYFAARFVHRRDELKETEQFIHSAGVDEYALVRNAYLQRRQYVIENSNNADSADDKNPILEDPPE